MTQVSPACMQQVQYELGSCKDQRNGMTISGWHTGQEKTVHMVRASRKPNHQLQMIAPNGACQLAVSSEPGRGLSVAAVIQPIVEISNMSNVWCHQAKNAEEGTHIRLQIGIYPGRSGRRNYTITQQGRSTGSIWRDRHERNSASTSPSIG